MGGDGYTIVLSMGFGGGLSMLYTHKFGSLILAVKIEWNEILDR